MPFSLASLVPGSAHRAPPRSPSIPAAQQHLVPPGRLKLSLSDPVLFAAEQYLANVPYWQDVDDGARNASKLGSLASRPVRSQPPGDAPLDPPQAVHPLKTATIPQAAHSCDAEATPHGLMDPSDDSDGFSDVATISSSTDRSFDDADVSPPESSPYTSDLPPLASDIFRQELYTRGYLKRPASRPTAVVPPKSRVCFMFGSRDAFPKVLGRRQGRVVAEFLKEQFANEASTGHLPDTRSSISVGRLALRTPQADSHESSWAGTSISEAGTPRGIDPKLFNEQPPTPLGCATPQTPRTLLSDIPESPWMYTTLFTTETPSAPSPHLSEGKPSVSVGCITPQPLRSDILESPCVDTTPAVAETPGGPDVHPEQQPSTTVGCITPRTDQTDDLESPWIYTTLFATETPDGTSTRSSERQPPTSLNCATPRTLQTDNLESPWMDTNLSVAETPSGPDAHPSKGQPSASADCLTPRALRSDAPESRCMNTNTSMAKLPSGPDPRLSKGQPSTTVSCITPRTELTDDLESPWIYTTLFATETPGGPGARLPTQSASVGCITPQTLHTVDLESPWIYTTLFATDTPHGPGTRRSVAQSSTPVTRATLRTPQSNGLESSVDITTSAFESFHEFSYLTAFTTPPPSPSVVLDAETFKKGVVLGSRKHAA